MKVCTGNALYDTDKWIRHYKKELRDHDEGLAENSLELYERLLDTFVDFISHKPIVSIKDIDAYFIKDFISWKEEQYAKKIGDSNFSYSTATKKIYILILKTLFDFIEGKAEHEADGSRYTFSSIFDELNKKRRGRRTKKNKSDFQFLTDDEVTNLLDYLDRMIESNGKHYNYIYSLAIRLMLYGGLRVSEAVSLTFQDIERHGDIIELHLEDTKSGSTQYIPIRHEHIAKELDYVYKASKKQSGYIVANRHFKAPLERSNLYKSVNKIYLKAGIKKKGLHILRHTSAMMLLDKTSDITTVQELLRHANITTTSIYIHRDVKQLGKIIV